MAAAHFNGGRMHENGVAKMFGDPEKYGISRLQHGDLFVELAVNIML